MIKTYVTSPHWKRENSAGRGVFYSQSFQIARAVRGTTLKERIASIMFASSMAICAATVISGKPPARAQSADEAFQRATEQIHHDEDIRQDTDINYMKLRQDKTDADVATVNTKLDAIHTEQTEQSVWMKLILGGVGGTNATGIGFLIWSRKKKEGSE